MKKKFLPSFQPPRLVKASQGWYIVWYEQNPVTGELQRFRKSFQLNRIEKKTDRNERARAIIEDVSRALAGGGYAFAGMQETGYGFTPLAEAVRIAEGLKTQSSSEATNHSYSSIVKIFLAWARREKLEEIPIKAFSRVHAMRFMDYVKTRRKAGSRTYNNYITFLRSIWNALADRTYVEANPWKQVRKVKEDAKKRRTFSPDEAAAAAGYMAVNHPELFLAVLLLYYCFVRPNEIRQLRRRDFNLESGALRIPADVAKTNRARLVTLPETVRLALLDRYGLVRPSYYLWGPNHQPHPNQQQGKNQFNKAHKAIMKKLHQSGTLSDIEGLTFYSWKDTGLTDHARQVSLLDLMQQAGHCDPKITMVYIHQGKENEAFKSMRSSWIGEEKIKAP